MLRSLSISVLLLLSVRLVMADEPTGAPRFETHVRPILKQHCFHCHGELGEKEGGLDLRLVRLMSAGGDSGAAIVAGNPDESLLYQRLRDGEMPPDEGKLLSDAEIRVVHDWLAAGAPTARPEPEDADGYIPEEELAHWAYQPITRPAVPAVEAADAPSVANPIDAFLLVRLREKGFGFSPPASSATLVRRLYFDLHGLPPDPAAVADDSLAANDAAWNQLVDELLASHHYGERWARHWLDVAGYADSEGYNDADAERPHAWRYRDYVIRSLNADKPYNQFIREQLAGDELVTSPLNQLTPADAELLTATGFLRMAPDGTGGAVDDMQVAINETIADAIKIVSTSLMGMTVGCAQCHDHRYDPISQVDYYRFRAIFEPAFDWRDWRRPPQRLVSLYTDQDRAAAAEVETQAKEIDAERTKLQQEFINATFEKQLEKLPVEIHDAARAAHAKQPKDRTAEEQALFKKHPSLNVTAGSLYLYDSKAAEKLKSLADDASKLRATKPKEEFVRALTERPGRVPVMQLFYRGDHEQPKQEVAPAGLAVVSQTAEVPDIVADAEELPTTGRRLALANRLTDPRHPLTARVIVNRVWLHHFGRGLVTSPGDFGVLGQPPTHPELLDWLAAELMDNQWSLKHLHRLILTSRAWRQQQRDNPELEQVDPENELYGGARLTRLDAEVVRDSMLAISGQLNLKPYGPAVPVMADTVGRFVVGKENLNAGRPGDVIDMHGEDLRRSIYIQVRRSRPLSVLDAFDLPAMTPNCDRRRPSTSSTQSLMMMNSDLVLEFSRKVADRLERDAADDRAGQVQRAWRLIYNRGAEDGEVESALRFLDEQTSSFAEQPAYQPKDDKPPSRSAAQEALAVMCQMLLSSNEFLYVE